MTELPFSSAAEFSALEFPTQGDPLCLRFNADSEEISSILIGLTQHLLQHGLSIEYVFRIELVLAEVLNNIAEHAYQDQGFGWIRLEVETQGEALQFHLADAGLAMPGLKLPEAKRYEPDSIELQDLPEGGFGWALIRDLTRELDYQRLTDHNHLRFFIDEA